MAITWNEFLARYLAGSPGHLAAVELRQRAGGLCGEDPGSGGPGSDRMSWKDLVQTGSRPRRAQGRKNRRNRILPSKG